jgi:hypothetical protein
MGMRIQLKAVCNTDDKRVHKNHKLSRRYQRVEWGVLKFPPCAVVGGSPALPGYLHHLRNWKGDIFAVNATAGYLSGQGIPHYLYAIDCDPKPWKIGPLTKGAIFASRVDRNQFLQFKRKDVRVFEMAEEDNRTGIEGGPTAACRAPHLFLRMGYRAVYFFGIDSCFLNESHITGTQDVARSSMLIVRAGGIDFLSNAALLLQAESMLEVFKKYPQFLFCASGGMVKAMLDNPDTWEVVAIGDDLKAQYKDGGCDIWNKEYKPEENKIWQPQPVILSQQPSIR